jgi:hypothetical protein
MLTTTCLLLISIQQVQAQKAPKPPKKEVAPPAPPVPPARGLPDSIVSINVSADKEIATVTYKMKDGRTLKMPLADAEKKGYPLPPPPPTPPVPVAGVKPAAIPAPAPIGATPPPTPPAVTPVPPVPPTKENSNGVKLFAPQPDGRPLIIYADLEISHEQMNQLDPASIESMDVLKGETAIKIYGEKGRNGVIKITPKSTGTTTIKDAKGEKLVLRPVEKDNSSTSKTLLVKSANSKEQPLYVVNGKKTEVAEAAKLLPDEIASMNVLKDKNATDKYGEAGKNGVIELTTKKVSPVFTSSEVVPSFPGGQEAWRRYLSTALKYPEKAQSAGSQGEATVKFIVEPMVIFPT